jgi:NAD(P)-dependent dehydrogenase (short-subunit alcohol dehydrogenase family)
MKKALITGASRGLGLALATRLESDGWEVVRAARSLGSDITDSWQRAALAEAVGDGLDLLVNNASSLGATPLPTLGAYPLAELRQAFEVNVFAPLALIQDLLPALRARGGAVLGISSDAAIEPYEGWGGYGASKAALDQLSAVLAVEEPTLTVWSVDPGEMQTQMLAAAGEDASAAPLPAEVAVPALLRLITSRAPSGRYSAKEL